MRRLKLLGVVGLSLTGFLLACGGGGNGPFPNDKSEPVITEGLVPQSFPVDQPISVPMRQRGDIRIQITEGQALTLTVEANGTGPLLYSWRRNGNLVNGANEARLKVENLVAGARLDEVFTVSIANPIGYTVSSAAFVRVLPKSK